MYLSWSDTTEAEAEERAEVTAVKPPRETVLLSPGGDLVGGDVAAAPPVPSLPEGRAGERAGGTTYRCSQVRTERGGGDGRTGRAGRAGGGPGLSVSPSSKLWPRMYLSWSATSQWASFGGAVVCGAGAAGPGHGAATGVDTYRARGAARGPPAEGPLFFSAVSRDSSLTTLPDTGPRGWCRVSFSSSETCAPTGAPLDVP